jgi:hypothetical protein
MVLNHRSVLANLADEGRLSAARSAGVAAAVTTSSKPASWHGSIADALRLHAAGRGPPIAYTLTMISDEQPLWGLGIALMIVGTVASSIGMLCFKRASWLQGTPWWRNPWFWSGLLLFVVTAAVLDAVVFAVTPLALIAPFAGLTIVVSFALATLGCCGVSEPATKTAAAAVLLIVIGVTICSIFGPKTDGELSPSDLASSFKRFPVLFWACALATPFFILFYVWGQFFKEDSRKCVRSWMGAAILALAAAVTGALTQLQFKSLASAIFEVVKSLGSPDPSANSSNLYDNTGEFVSQLLCVGSSGIAQIGFLNMAITGAPVAYTVPAYQSLLLLGTLLISAFVLDEFPSLSTGDTIAFSIGTSVIVIGMLLNAWGLARVNRRPKTEDSSMDGAMADSGKSFEAGLPGVTDPEAAAASRKAAAAAKYG